MQSQVLRAVMSSFPHIFIPKSQTWSIPGAKMQTLNWRCSSCTETDMVTGTICACCFKQEPAEEIVLHQTMQDVFRISCSIMLFIEEPNRAGSGRKGSIVFMSAVLGLTVLLVLRCRMCIACAKAVCSMPDHAPQCPFCRAAINRLLRIAPAA